MKPSPCPAPRPATVTSATVVRFLIVCGVLQWLDDGRARTHAQTSPVDAETEAATAVPSTTDAAPPASTDAQPPAPAPVPAPPVGVDVTTQPDDAVPAPPPDGRLCFQHRRHVMTDAGVRSDLQLGERCYPLSPTPTAPGAAFPIAAVGDAVRFSGRGGTPMALCTEGSCAPLPASGTWQPLTRAGLLQLRAGIDPARGRVVLQAGVIDAGAQWLPTGLIVDDDEPPPRNRWTGLPRDAHDVLAFERRRQRMHMHLRPSDALTEAWNAGRRPSRMSRELPRARPAASAQPPDAAASAFVLLVTRSALCPTAAAGALDGAELVAPEAQVTGAEFHVHLAHFRGKDAPYQCLASAEFIVTPARSVGAGAVRHLRAGLFGDTHALMFVMPAAAVGLGHELAFARYGLAFGFGLDAAAQLTAGALVDGSAISRAGLGLNLGAHWGPPDVAPRLLSVGFMFHLATGNHDVPVGSLYTGLDLSTLLDMAGGR